jgi:hypothetical protein
MGTKRICLIAALLLWTSTLARAATGPVGWWKLDEKSGTVAGDASGNGNNGTVNGGAQWANGQLGGALQCDGADDYVALPIGPLISSLTNSTFTIWANYSQAGGNWQRLFDIGTGETVNMFLTPAIGGSNTGVMRFAITTGGSGAESQLSAPSRLATGWHHIAVVINATTMNMQLYLDGAVVVSGTTAVLPQNLGNTTQNWLGRSEYGADAYYSGALDDFRIYDRTLTQAEVLEAMQGGLTGTVAADPRPADGATDVLRETSLSWVATRQAATHDVYFGTSADDVKNATKTSPLGVLVSPGQDANSYEPPERLELGQTYFWRVDEVNAAPDYTVFPGPVWSFTVEPYSYPVTGITATASSEDRATMGPERTVDGSGLDPDTDGHSVTGTDMWLSNKKGEQPTWIQYAFARPEKLDKMAVWNSNQIVESSVGLGARLVTVEYSLDGVAWTALGDFEFAQAPGEADYQANTDVPFGGVMAQYVKLTIQSNWGELLPQYGLSEVRFYALPVQARQPSPATGATAVNPQVDLSWRAGREAATHEVYLGEDQQAVVEGTASAATVSAPEYEASLLLSKDYYWKVIEVNEAETPSNWDSEVWSFTTNDFVVVDDFESYTDEEDVGRRIYETWIDGWDDPSNNGGVVGYSDPPFAEQEVLHGGQQSMPLSYDNGSGAVYSEATRTFASAQDWTQHGITTLVVYFRGLSANSPAPLYVKINNTKVVFNNGAAATTFPVWKQWDIPLAGTGANLQSVKSLTIGIGDGQAGGTGMLYVDDLRLYATAPAVVSPVDPGTTGLVAYYAMEGNVQDGSGKNNHGTASGDTLYDTGVVGQALSFNGTNTYVDLPIGTALSTMSDVTVATYVYFENTGGSWQRIFDFGTGTTNYMFLTPRQGTGGPIRFAIRTATVGEQVVNAPATLPSGWHHVAVVIASATMTIQLYLDGELVGSGATTLLPKDMGVTTQNWLGRSQWTADAYLTGSLDEFRIFTRALSASEVRYLAGDR